ncbi:hypothetical protein TDB9533_01705 [Thalassocella blandensis]|nr:hypothetical protein TDB9533_01705 [Thalassocella blandensis]
MLNLLFWSTALSVKAWGSMFDVNKLISFNVNAPKQLALKVVSVSVFFFSAPLVTANIVGNKSTVSQSDASIMGKAYSLDGKELLYTEFYTQLDDAVWRVQYISNEDKLVADKTINYEYSKIQPSFTIKNYWAKEVSVVELRQNKLKVSHGELQDKTDALDFEMLEKNGLIVDAGFVAFILEHWDEFQQEKVFEYPFVVPSRLSTITMQTQQVRCQQDLLNEEYLMRLQQDASGKEFYSCFRTRAKNALLRLLVSDIFLVFSQGDKKLMRFKGLGNIADQNGKMLKVDIHYTYF